MLTLFSALVVILVVFLAAIGIYALTLIVTGSEEGSTIMCGAFCLVAFISLVIENTDAKQNSLDSLLHRCIEYKQDTAACRLLAEDYIARLKEVKTNGHVP